MTRWFGLILGLSLLPAGPARADDAAGEELFEKEVRPILAERCQSCHGAEKHKNGLRLDSRAALLEGGISGPAVVPGKPDESLLIQAVHYSDALQMPPKARLPEAEIAALTRWVERGAPWPSAGPSKGSAPRPFDLAERAKHWSFQPVRAVEPPSVRDGGWPLGAVDRFLLSTLEAHDLRPAPDADRRTLIRRVTFDLIGLPPTPAEIDAFLNDASPTAYEKVVDRLLASPHYGERWGRHWLDLVRFAETAGHEFDYDAPDAWRYRDYVVRAFNADLPFDDFLIEHIAGDLLASPRRDPVSGTNESVLATGFYFLGEGTHSPVDVREDEVRRIDNQIDVLSKAFLGLTVSCARCHDHKFDAISTKDYYALAGYLQSSRAQHAFLDPPGAIGGPVAELKNLTAQLAGRLKEAALGEGVAARLIAMDGAGGNALAAWKELTRPDADKRPLAERSQALLDRLQAEARPDSTELFEDFRRPTFDGWFPCGDAFGAGPTRSGDWVLAADGRILPVAPGVAHSGLVSDRLQGVLRSRTFTIERPKIYVNAWGRQGRINVVIDGFEKIRAPIYGGLTIGVDAPTPRWHEIDVAMWAGHSAYLELADGGTVNYTGPQAVYFPGEGFLAVDEIRFGEATPSRRPAVAVLDELLDPSGLDSPDVLARRFELAATAAARDWCAGRLTTGERDRERFALLAELIDAGVIELPRAPAEWVSRARQIDQQIPAPTLALAITDGTGEDEHVLIRGNHKTPGPVVPRRFLEAMGGESDSSAPINGSGRLELARQVADAGNPLTARVIVNRLWQHHFGVGLVRTPDDFGAMGQPPSHPELLDWLAARFVADGWSIKAMQRRLVLSRAYRMASTPEAEAERADPDNRLLHRMNVRRLEAEAIRDAMLAVSGGLDPALGGPSVPPHLTPFMEGRGRPAASGPLDGRGRRSLYINVRRNFLTPMLLAFDFPAPASTMGRRNASNVPAQALTLLNDPFVLDQSRRWATRLISSGPRPPEARLDALYLAAFGRPATADERAALLAFLGPRASADDPAAWAEVGHVLFNAKEFIFVY